MLTIAHTSRFIWSFTRAKQLLESGTYGSSKFLAYQRWIHHPAGKTLDGRQRSWINDVFIHHTAHLLDLCLDWFGSEVRPAGVLSPTSVWERRNATVLVQRPGELPMCAALSYDASEEALRITLVMESGSIEVDGFVRLGVNGKNEVFDRPENKQAAYQEAIVRQDRDFFRLCLVVLDFQSARMILCC